MCFHIISFKHSFFLDLFNKYFLSSYYVPGIVGNYCQLCQPRISDIAKQPKLELGPSDFKFSDLCDTSYAGCPDFCYMLNSSRITLRSQGMKQSSRYKRSNLGFEYYGASMQLVAEFFCFSVVFVHSDYSMTMPQWLVSI